MTGRAACHEATDGRELQRARMLPQLPALLRVSSEGAREGAQRVLRGCSEGAQEGTQEGTTFLAASSSSPSLAPAPVNQR